MGMCRASFRRQPLKDKRGKENFRRTVRACFSRDVVTAERIRLFSQRARAYMLPNHKIWRQQLTNTSPTSDFDNTTASPVKVEKMLKEFKTHRCAMNFDSNFCKTIFLDDAHHDREDDTKASSSWLIKLTFAMLVTENVILTTNWTSFHIVIIVVLSLIYWSQFEVQNLTTNWTSIHTVIIVVL
jgi:hypothetical protein